MQNGTLIQFFHWYSIPGGDLWDHFKDQAPYLARLGINAAWLPPAYKATGGGYSVGYDIYDLYDLGEFDQKGTVRTRYGTKQEYIDAVRALQKHGIQVLVDIVVNHKGGGDETETMMAVKVDPEDRNKQISEPMAIEAYTLFNFPG